jgi:hypothetical protein
MQHSSACSLQPQAEFGPQRRMMTNHRTRRQTLPGLKIRSVDAYHV